MGLADLDFTQSRQAMSRLNQILGYEVVNKRSQEGAAQNIMLQDQLIGERQQNKAALDVAVDKEKSKNSIREIYVKSMTDAQRMPGMAYLSTIVNMAGDPNLPEQYKPLIQEAQAKYAMVIKGLAELAQKVVDGGATADDYEAAVNLGPDNFLGMVKESGANLRARMEATAKKEQTAATLEGHRLTAAGQGAEAIDRKIKAQLATIDMAMDRIRAEGIPGNPVDTAALAMYTSGKAFDPMAPENRSTALEGLTRVRNEVARGNLMTPGNENFVARVMGFSQILADEKAAGKVSPAPVIPSYRSGVAPAEEAEIRAQQYQNELNYWTDMTMKLLPGMDWAGAQKQAKAFMEKMGQNHP